MAAFPKRQHYVPKTLLNHFCDDDGWLWVGRKDRRRVFRQRPQHVFVRNHIYTRRSYTGASPSAEYEHVLSGIENDAAPVISRIVGCARRIEPLAMSPTELRALQTFVFAAGLQDTGVPTACLSPTQRRRPLQRHPARTPRRSAMTIYPTAMPSLADSGWRDFAENISHNADASFAAGDDPRVDAERAKFAAETGVRFRGDPRDNQELRNRKPWYDKLRRPRGGPLSGGSSAAPSPRCPRSHHTLAMHARAVGTPKYLRGSRRHRRCQQGNSDTERNVRRQLRDPDPTPAQLTRRFRAQGVPYVSRGQRARLRAVVAAWRISSGVRFICDVDAWTVLGLVLLAAPRLLVISRPRRRRCRRSGSTSDASQVCPVGGTYQAKWTHQMDPPDSHCDPQRPEVPRLPRQRRRQAAPRRMDPHPKPVPMTHVDVDPSSNFPVSLSYSSPGWV